MTVAEDDPRIQRCGFAKLQGVDNTFEYFIRKYEVILGRKSNSTQADVVIGEHSSISRKHAIIRYNFTKGVWCGKVNQHNRIDYPSSTGAFELEVLSKNGVTIEGTLHTPDSGPVALHSQDTITVSDQSFVFLLPKDVRRTIAERMVMQPPPGAPAVPASVPALQTPTSLPPWPAATAQPQINPLALATFSSLQQQALSPTSAQEQMAMQLAALQQQQAALQQQQAALQQRALAERQLQQQHLWIAALQQHAANGLGGQPPQQPPPS